MDFDDRGGIVACITPWGRWWQTMEDVTVEVEVPHGTRAKDIICTVKPRHLYLNVGGKAVLSGNFSKTVQASESVWSLEDRKLIRICLVKDNNTAADCWTSLLEGEFGADASLVDRMQQKLTLERFQRENPGMDFSGAAITGNYGGGGPVLP